ncbi:MAG TPA: sigma-70 family RNA polymerase sigma factor [Anaerolineales bacterium]|nr:sigma-70 family RNA polymerase sigma factor [Anaerolineales bacterium]
MEELGTLVSAAQSGNKDAFGRIVTRFQDMAYGIAFAMLGDPGRAQDAAQEAFIDAYLCVGKLRQPEAFPGWFRRIVIKHSDRQMRKARLETVSLEEASLSAGEPDNLESIVERSQANQVLHAAVAALPYNQRMATILFYSRGYSLREIASILELPETTIKKSLHDSRQKLKRKMVTMLQENLNANKPSQNEQFVNKVQFFLALKSGELKKIKQLLKTEPQLLYVHTEWGVASDGFYWPLGVTALHWAACTGNRELLEFLFSKVEDVDILTKSGRTPLHMATIMRQAGIARLLLGRGANPNAITPAGQTALHFAVLRNSLEMAALLLEHDASSDIPDSNGRTPLDWAVQKGLEPMVQLLAQSVGAPTSQDALESGPNLDSEPSVDEAYLGRVLNERGERLNHLAPAAGIERQQFIQQGEEARSPVFHTGIKIIDLFAPLRRGGLN